MSNPKPRHLGSRYGAQFEDASVAAAYHARPPYPTEFFDVLDRLQSSGGGAILDLGCGTGDVTLGLVSRAQRIDAVDPSPAMLAVAHGRPGADHPGIRWTCAAAETFEFAGPYSLVVAGESLHWMEWDAVMPKIASALAPQGWLVLADRSLVSPMPWDEQLARLIATYSTNREFRPYDLVHELASRGHFRPAGRHTTAAVPFSQSIDMHIESFHSRNGFSRQRMPSDEAREFDQSFRRLLERHCPDGFVRLAVVANITWGVPLTA
jgi:SAM-dependent methyltransferase